MYKDLEERNKKSIDTIFYYSIFYSIFVWFFVCFFFKTLWQRIIIIIYFIIIIQTIKETK